MLNIYKIKEKNNNFDLILTKILIYTNSCVIHEICDLKKAFDSVLYKISLRQGIKNA